MLPLKCEMKEELKLEILDQMRMGSQKNDLARIPSVTENVKHDE